MILLLHKVLLLKLSDFKIIHYFNLKFNAGYTLNFKRENDDWQTIDLSPDSNTFTLEDLKCGSTYHLYITAHNRVGEGNPSSIVIASTKGGGEFGFFF